MGRFDALTQIEEKPITPTPSLVVASPALKQPQMQPQKKQGDGIIKPAYPQKGKPENLHTRKQVNPLPSIQIFESPEKYSTRLEPSLVKKIKMYAAEKDLKDYEVIKEALREYFHKKQQ